MQKIINVLAILFIVVVSIWVTLYYIGISTIAIDPFEAPLTLILSAAALLTCSSTLRSHLVKRKAYTIEPKAFVNRESQIETITHLVCKGKSIINVFGITGIGVTHLLQFLTDLYNKQLPLKIRYHYCKFPKILFGFFCRAYYVHIEKSTSLSEIVSILNSSLFVNAKDIHTITELCTALSRKLKFNSRLVLLFDGIHIQEQMYLVEEFATQYLSLRTKDTLVIGTHQRFLSYQHNYDHMEILKFEKSHLMILAEVHKADLDERTKIQLYEITDGIPLFAYLLLKEGKAKELEGKQDLRNIYAYLKEYVISSLSRDEQCALEKIALLTLSVSEIRKNEMKLIDLVGKEDIVLRLSEKGLIYYSKARNQITIPKAIAKLVIVCASEHDVLCVQLYKYYKSIQKNHFAVLYLLLSEQNNGLDNKFIECNLREWIEKRDILSMAIALEPTIEFIYDVKSNHTNVYVLYLYSCIYMLSSCGEYPRAKDLLNQLQIDGMIIQSYGVALNKDNFKLHFIWADIEHLLNNYNIAIDIINSLIINSEKFGEFERLPQLFWMKAHCLRHQARDLSESYAMYQQSEKIALQQSNSEYVIRTLHGQICISLIQLNLEFNFEKVFTRLDQIYIDEPKKWEAYQYNTFKYKSIYCRLWGKQNAEKKALDLLQKAFDGFVNIRKRNIYDVHFEFGEYYRFYNQFDKSLQHYQRCVEFAKHNTDYNLESLAQLGIILISIEQGNHGNTELLLEIIRESQLRDLNLSIHYARYILNKIKTNSHNEIKLLLFNP